MLEEEFKPVPGYPNYKVSNYGRVVNVNSGKELKTYLGSSGGYFVQLSLKGKPAICVMMHRLVAEVFLESFDPQYQVTHKNAIKSDNGILNLEQTEMRVRMAARHG